MASEIELKKVALYWADEYQRYTRMLEQGTLSVDRIHPDCRVTWSDLTAKFQWLTLDDREALQGYINREARRRKVQTHPLNPKTQIVCPQCDDEVLDLDGHIQKRHPALVSTR